MIPIIIPTPSFYSGGGGGSGSVNVFEFLGILFFVIYVFFPILFGLLDGASDASFGDKRKRWIRLYWVLPHMRLVYVIMYYLCEGGKK